MSIPIVKDVTLEIPGIGPDQPETVESLKAHIRVLEDQLTEMGKDLACILLPFVRNDAEGLLAALSGIARDHCQLAPQSSVSEVH